jgi:16S rRNA (adenine1518-N6/adenine1519-N6)-dimethyltransferase
MTWTPTQVRDLLDRYGIEPSRALGQNFVADPNTVRRIARLARVGPGDRVVEVGPGLGSLTLALVETGAEVVGIERDRHVLPVLAREVPQARVVSADALDVDWGEVLLGPGWVLVANLPYNVATTLVLDVLERAPQVHRLLVMVQKEVAERMAAGPGSRVYGVPSVKRAWWADAAVVGDVPATVFVPRPNVASALVELTRRPEPGGDRAATFALVDRAFGQRRKMLRVSLATVVSAPAFAAAGVDPTARPEQLPLAGWVALAAALAAGAG